MLQTDQDCFFHSSFFNVLCFFGAFLQEKDYEIFSLRNQLTQQSSSKDSEIDQLTRKLGQTEYETKKSQEKEKELQSSLKREIEKLSSQVL